MKVLYQAVVLASFMLVSLNYVRIVQQTDGPQSRLTRSGSAGFRSDADFHYMACKSSPTCEKDYSVSLKEAIESKSTVIYFLHQRKAGGTALRSILYTQLVNAIGREAAKARSFVPCVQPRYCLQFEMKLYEENYLGSVKLVGAHMSYHTPFARSSFENQVLITNFREPISRIKSCMRYRYPGRVTKTFDVENFTLAAGEALLMSTKDRYNSTCVQEPFRILSPFDPDKEPISETDIRKVCRFVRKRFHLTLTTPFPAAYRLTQIEKDLIHLFNEGNTTANRNKRPFISETEETNLEAFLEHIRATNPYIHSEQRLYECVLGLSNEATVSSSG